jgi:hypothetical protein
MPRPTAAAAAPAHRDGTTGLRVPRLRLLAVLLLALAALLLRLLPTVEAAPAALRLAAWFDQAPAELLAHVAACRDIGAAGARMVGCKVQLGSQPQECVYVPAKDFPVKSFQHVLLATCMRQLLGAHHVSAPAQRHTQQPQHPRTSPNTTHTL